MAQELSPEFHTVVTVSVGPWFIRTPLCYMYINLISKITFDVDLFQCCYNGPYLQPSFQINSNFCCACKALECKTGKLK